MIDIHTHILPNIDDGCTSWEQSLVMVKELIDNGITEAYCTPHHHVKRGFIATTEQINEVYHDLCRRCKDASLPIVLHLGQEIFYNESEEIFDMLDLGQLLTLDKTKKILLEFSTESCPKNFDNIVFDAQMRGYQVIIAHAERYPWMTFEKIWYLKNEGAEIQINADSLMGHCGLSMSSLCKKLIKFGLVDYVASDIHSFRKCYMQQAYRKYKIDYLFMDKKI